MSASFITLYTAHLQAGNHYRKWCVYFYVCVNKLMKILKKKKKKEKEKNHCFANASRYLEFTVLFEGSLALHACLYTNNKKMKMYVSQW